METTVEVERLEDGEEVLPSYEILRENLKRRPQRKAATQLKPQKCLICFEMFPNKQELLAHSSSHDQDKPFACEKCPYSTNIRKNLTRHQLKVHSKATRKHSCSFCPRMFHFKCNLEEHQRKHTGEKPYKCDVCEKAFANSYSLRTHKFIHTNEKPFKCSYCEYACRDCSTLRKHESRHLGIVKMYRCEKCPYQYETKARLQAHFKDKHSTYEGMKCDQCDALLKNKWTLRNHIKAVHDKLTRCKCGICGKELSNHANLSSHMRSHITLRPAVCPHPGCGKRYKDMGALKKHTAIHDPSRQYMCAECDRAFTRKYRLVVHLRQHQLKEKNVECDCCGARFYNSNYLKNHMRTKHDSRKQKFFCDLCCFETTNKPSLVMHLKYGHNSEMDKVCKICNKKYKRNKYLRIHYKKSHQISYKSIPEPPKPEPEGAMRIKEEPLDLIPDLEIDLLDIEKEEPFFGFEDHIDEGLNPERTAFDKVSEDNLANRDEGTSEELGTQKDAELSEEKKGEESVEGGIGDIATENPAVPTIRHPPAEKREKPKRKAMQVGEFLQRVIAKAEANDEEEELEDLEALAKRRVRELMQKSDQMKGLARREYGAKRLRRPTETEIEEAKRRKLSRAGVVMEREDTKEITSSSSSSQQESVSDKEEVDAGKSSTSNSLKFNLHQCYVCYKVFQTKPELIKHCKEHFDVCNEYTLKKCPFCPYVTKGHIKTHFRLKHRAEVSVSFMNMKDKRDNDNGSRYYLDARGENVERLEIIPSIKLLNKKASMDLDRRNREMRDKRIVKRKLVRKGKEWVVVHENLDVNGCMIPKKTEVEGDYLAYLKKLSVDAKKNGVRMLYPCNGCEKICQNLSALTLHMRRHDPNPKPFKKKVWKHKIAEEPVTGKPVTEKPVPGTANRNAKPKPIVNKHKCDRKLMEFYEKNIKGGDIEFWQFLKIFNKMDRENVKDFCDLESRTDFGIHCSQESVARTDNSGTKTASGNTQTKVVKKKCVSLVDSKKRLEAKKRLREKIAMESHQSLPS